MEDEVNEVLDQDREDLGIKDLIHKHHEEYQLWHVVPVEDRARDNVVAVGAQIHPNEGLHVQDDVYCDNQACLLSVYLVRRVFFLVLRFTIFLLLL